MNVASSRLGAGIFGASDDTMRHTGLAILRIAVGAIFVAHGAQKFFMLGIPAVTDGFAQAGIPMAPFMAPFIASVEFFAGIALVLGLLTRLAALGTASTMLGAMLLVHLKGGFFLPTGIEYTVALLAASLALILMGPGRFSLDAPLSRRASPAVVRAGRPADRRAA